MLPPSTFTSTGAPTCTNPAEEFDVPKSIPQARLTRSFLFYEKRAHSSRISMRLRHIFRPPPRRARLLRKLSFSIKHGVG